MNREARGLGGRGGGDGRRRCCSTRGAGGAAARLLDRFPGGFCPQDERGKETNTALARGQRLAEGLREFSSLRSLPGVLNMLLLLLLDELLPPISQSCCVKDF
ncbi:hypothetical protein LUU34_00981700 [Aix galericulata]|nr:hypothetical protein LUU34_00981700 [Aix galericulata]